MIAALGLAFLSGFIALSYEILWYRAFSFASGTAANTFGLLLGAYLLGLALGVLAVRSVCRDSDAAARSLQLAFLVRLIVFANVIGFLVVPCLGWLMTAGATRTWSLVAVGVAAAGLGTVFPLLSHLAIEPDDHAGRRVSYVYLTNILGSTAGSLGTGFVLMDHLSLAATHLLLFFLGLAMAMLPLFLDTGRPRTVALAAIGVLGLAGALFGTKPFDGIYEKLQLKTEYTRERRFKHVVETRSGVITVNEKDQIFGGGIYDGAFNTRLYPDKNLILRCYAAISELHPAPREVLMIGLSSGSWATVVANHPGVTRLTVIEINPGYLGLIRQYPDVAGLLTNPKVEIHIDDGRRWLTRNADRKFDAVLANTTFHWRSNASNLLSVEFLELIRSHLNPGGFYFYNTTDSLRVAKTGCSVFKNALMIAKFIAVGDSSLAVDPSRLRERLLDYPLGTGTVFDRNNPEDLRRLDEVTANLRKLLRTREQILSGCPEGLRLITDDNMGTEWGEGTQILIP